MSLVLGQPDLVLDTLARVGLCHVATQRVLGQKLLFADLAREDLPIRADDYERSRSAGGPFLGANKLRHDLRVEGAALNLKIAEKVGRSLQNRLGFVGLKDLIFGKFSVKPLVGFAAQGGVNLIEIKVLVVVFRLINLEQVMLLLIA